MGLANETCKRPPSVLIGHAKGKITDGVKVLNGEIAQVIKKRQLRDGAPIVNVKDTPIQLWDALVIAGSERMLGPRDFSCA